MGPLAALLGLRATLLLAGALQLILSLALVAVPSVRDLVDVGPKKALADGWSIHLSALHSASAVFGQLRLPDIPSDALAAGCAARSRSRCQ
jgi:hypothetical protein